jgi:hypothetical protein
MLHAFRLYLHMLHAFLSPQIGFAMAMYEAKTALPVYLERSGASCPDAPGGGVSYEQLVDQVGSPDVRTIFAQLVPSVSRVCLVYV